MEGESDAIPPEIAELNLLANVLLEQDHGVTKSL